jgi:hypothetical protein
MKEHVGVEDAAAKLTTVVSDSNHHSKAAGISQQSG